MRLTEGTHFERIVIEPRRIINSGGQPWGYCSAVFNGRATVYRVTHPDIDIDDLAQYAQQQERLDLARKKS